MDFNSEELKVIKGCLLTTKETLKLVPFKNSSMKKNTCTNRQLIIKISGGFLVTPSDSLKFETIL